MGIGAGFSSFAVEVVVGVMDGNGSVGDVNSTEFEPLPPVKGSEAMVFYTSRKFGCDGNDVDDGEPYMVV